MDTVAWAFVIVSTMPITIYCWILVFNALSKRPAQSLPLPSTQEHVLAALRAARELGDEGDLEALAATLYVPVLAPIQPK